MGIPTKHAAKWESEEDNKLLDLFDEGACIEDLIVEFDRTILSIINRLVFHKRLISTFGGFVRRDPFFYVTAAWVQDYRDNNEQSLKEAREKRKAGVGRVRKPSRPPRRDGGGRGE